MNILYEDNHIIVVEKPVNMPVQADESQDADLLSLVKAYIKERYQKPGDVYLGMVHRLDRPVGGVMVFARTSKAAARLTAQFATRAVGKGYVAVVQGECPAAGNLSDFLLKDAKTFSSRVVEKGTAGAKEARLAYRRLQVVRNQSLVDIALQTGRSHQIRVQFTHAGFPIWGDQRYNVAAVVGQQIALWAYSLKFQHPVQKTDMAFYSLPYGGAWEAFHRQIALLPLGIQLLYQDDDIVAINKPVGWEVSRADAGEDSLQAKLESAVGELHAVHRLDRKTSGIVVFARHAVAQRELEMAFAEHRVRKLYQCVVKGPVAREQAELHAYSVKDAQAATMQVVATPCPGAKEMITRYRVLAQADDLALLEVELITGRTHQIRAHLGSVGYPLLGDDKYGDWAFNRKYHMQAQVLVAVAIRFCFGKESVLRHLNQVELNVQPNFPSAVAAQLRLGDVTRRS